MNMTRFQIQLLVAIRLDVDAVMHTVNLCGAIVRMKQLKLGTGGLTVATKLICDRCGAEINPMSSVTYAGIRRLKMEVYNNDYELCVSCAHKLRAWLSGEENDYGKTD